MEDEVERRKRGLAERGFRCREDDELSGFVAQAVDRRSRALRFPAACFRRATQSRSRRAEAVALSPSMAASSVGRSQSRRRGSQSGLSIRA